MFWMDFRMIFVILFVLVVSFDRFIMLGMVSLVFLVWIDVIRCLVLVNGKWLMWLIFFVMMILLGCRFVIMCSSLGWLVCVLDVFLW